MVLCNVECVERISQYLEIKTGELQLTENDIVVAKDFAGHKSLDGFNTIVQALTEKSKCPVLLGKDDVTRALTRQWLEYAVVCVNYASNSDHTKRVLKELSTALKCNTYITGTGKTIADIVLYYTLHSIMRKLTQEEKARYVHLSRWFDNMQQEEKLRQGLDLICFDLMHLYL